MSPRIHKPIKHQLVCFSRAVLTSSSTVLLGAAIIWYKFALSLKSLGYMDDLGFSTVSTQLIIFSNLRVRRIAYTLVSS